MLDNVSALSAPGSWLVCESMPGLDGAAAAVLDGFRDAVENWRKHGLDVEMTDLWYFDDDRHDVAGYLSRRGWVPTETTTAKLFAAHRQQLAGPDQENQDFGAVTYVIAKRVGSH